MRVKIASYNIQYGVGLDGQYDLSRCQAALQDHDIIALQEVTTHWRACRGENQPELLAAGLNLFAAYAPAYEADASRRSAEGVVVNARRGFGNMVLSRWPILYSRAHALPRPSTPVPAAFHPSVDFPRSALEAVIEVEGRPLRVISLHLSQLPGGQRSAQIEVLKNLVLGLPLEAALWPDDPRVATWSEDRPAPPVPRASLILGDFNFRPEAPEYALLTAPGPNGAPRLVDAWAASDERLSDPRTCVENDGGLSRLDYLFVTEDLAGALRSAAVDQACKASDHFPLTFELDL